MATEDHKTLANFIKNVHSELRLSSAKLGVETAWSEHCQNVDKLSKYAECMEKLAITHWEEHCSDKKYEAISRIKWAVDFSYDYFKRAHMFHQEKEIEIGKKINLSFSTEENVHEPFKLLDVGSCYNPFRRYPFLDVLAIDLYPANKNVHQCDILKVKIGVKSLFDEEMKVIELKKCSFDIVTFCFVLEYIPSSNLRLKACKQAYNLLKTGGLLIITTPDSKHVGANSKLMKCWRYSLACIGFNRIKYEKLPHMHCMAFRKSSHIDIAIRWAALHKEDYMKEVLHIPQDFQKHENISETTNVRRNENEIQSDFLDMPFCNILLE